MAPFMAKRLTPPLVTLVTRDTRPRLIRLGPLVRFARIVRSVEARAAPHREYSAA